MKLFTKIGSGIDWLFAETATATKGIVTAPEVRRVIGVGIASGLAGSSTFLAEALASQSKTDLGKAFLNGFSTAIIGGTVSYLHRKADGAPPSPTEAPAP